MIHAVRLGMEKGCLPSIIGPGRLTSKMVDAVLLVETELAKRLKEERKNG